MGFVPIYPQERGRYACVTGASVKSCALRYVMLNMCGARSEERGARIDRLRCGLLLWQGLLPPDLMREAVLEEFVPGSR